MEITLSNTLPPYPTFVEGIRRAPDRGYTLTPAQTATALKNALRYVPKELHETLAPEFMEELRTRGRIYGYRYRPQGDLKAKPIDAYKGNCIEGKAFQVMIDNNLCFDIALYPYELVTYGETGQVCQNWMQYRLIKQYLEVLTQDQTLVIESGHPLGLFRSKPDAPRVIITNAMMVGLYDNQKDWHVAMQMGVANYGQMTAGGWMYIGPQGIVHGTFNTLLNAGRMKLGIPQNGDLRGHLFISSGLGGMSGAQPKAAEMSGAASIIAEVDMSRIETRHRQGWVGHVTDSIPEAFSLAHEAMDGKKPISIAYHGNIVDLLEYAVDRNIHIDLLSDQTSCHAVYEGGYCPVGITFSERTSLLHENPQKFCGLVNESLARHFRAIKALVGRGTYFFDYGNSFMKAVYDAGVREIAKEEDDKNGFIFPSYVEDIMGPELFDYGYGPFRWVCSSGDPKDLAKTDEIAARVLEEIKTHSPKEIQQQMDDNIRWIKAAMENHLVVGSQARILYADAEGRIKIAEAFNKAIAAGEISAPVILGRDHHDVSGTDSPYRETSNIYDGSRFTADMAIHNVIGDSFRGATWVSIHNGGGVGWGEVINGGFGMMLDGSADSDRRLKNMLFWDVNNGISRRSWARNEGAVFAIKRAMEVNPNLKVTLPNFADDQLIESLF